MKRLFYLLIGLVLLPALLYAQGTLSLKDINDNVTNNYYTKVASDARYPLDSDTYDTAEVDAKLLLKADKTYVNATDEAILLDDDSQDVQIEANRVAITLKATQIDMDSAEAKINSLNIDDDSQDVAINALNIDVDSAEVAINLNNIDDDSQDVTIESNRVRIESAEVAINGIIVGSGFATEAWVNSTLETNFYTKAQTNATIEAAIAAIPATDLSNYTTLAQTSEEVLVHNENATAHANRIDTLETQVTKINPTTIGNSKYYGTDSGGVVGYNDLPSSGTVYEVLLETKTADGSTSLYTFSSGLSSIYLRYRLMVECGAGTSNSSLCVYFNGDTAGNYTRIGRSQVAGSASTDLNNSGLGYYYATAAIYHQCSGEFLISNNTTFNHLITSNFIVRNDSDSTFHATLCYGIWASNAAITSISIRGSNLVNFTSGSTFSLYGLK